MAAGSVLVGMSIFITEDIRDFDLECELECSVFDAGFSPTRPGVRFRAVGGDPYHTTSERMCDTKGVGNEKLDWHSAPKVRSDDDH